MEHSKRRKISHDQYAAILEDCRDSSPITTAHIKSTSPQKNGTGDATNATEAPTLSKENTDEPTNVAHACGAHYSSTQTTNQPNGALQDLDQAIRNELTSLAAYVEQTLDHTKEDDCLKQCGLAAMQILKQHPGDVVKLAHQKLHTWPYSEVPTCWRRLYEEASLWKAVQVLKDVVASTGQSFKWLDDLVEVLDMGMALSGTPGRRDLFHYVFSQLGVLAEQHREAGNQYASPFPVDKPVAMNTQFPIQRVESALSFEQFQKHTTASRQPLILSNVIDDWPASHKWRDTQYLLKVALGGRRLVPVEIGGSYTDHDWGQRIMRFGDYMERYLMPREPREIGYLAQHDLFAQLPQLRNDILVPDYCYTAPPLPATPPRNASETKAAGLSPLEEPLLNAWLGPKGTKSPLHTDPYHNILCQVVGYKYVRLYSPDETEKVYPRGVDETGVDMCNTSSIDIDMQGRSSCTSTSDVEDQFPNFKEAVYQEAIIGPGDCLYIPLAWWHYVESLSVSFSVSFWWN